MQCVFFSYVPHPTHCHWCNDRNILEKDVWALIGLDLGDLPSVSCYSPFFPTWPRLLCRKRKQRHRVPTLQVTNQALSRCTTLSVQNSHRLRSPYSRLWLPNRSDNNITFFKDSFSSHAVFLQAVSTSKRATPQEISFALKKTAITCHPVSPVSVEA